MKEKCLKEVRREYIRLGSYFENNPYTADTAVEKVKAIMQEINSKTPEGASGGGLVLAILQGFAHRIGKISKFMNLLKVYMFLASLTNSPRQDFATVLSWAG